MPTISIKNGSIKGTRSPHYVSRPDSMLTLPLLESTSVALSSNHVVVFLCAIPVTVLLLIVWGIYFDLPSEPKPSFTKR